VDAKHQINMESLLSKHTMALLLSIRGGKRRATGYEQVKLMKRGF